MRLHFNLRRTSPRNPKLDKVLREGQEVRRIRLKRTREQWERLVAKARMIAGIVASPEDYT